MRYLGSMLALFALTASAPALASDYTPEHLLTESRVTAVRHEEAAPAAQATSRHMAPCTCACPRRTTEDRRSDAARAEPGGH